MIFLLDLLLVIIVRYEKTKNEKRNLCEINNSTLLAETGESGSSSVNRHLLALDPLEPRLLAAYSWEEFHDKVTDEADDEFVQDDQYLQSADQYLQGIVGERDIFFG